MLLDIRFFFELLQFKNQDFGIYVPIFLVMHLKWKFLVLTARIQWDGFSRLIMSLISTTHQINRELLTHLLHERSIELASMDAQQQPNNSWQHLLHAIQIQFAPSQLDDPQGSIS